MRLVIRRPALLAVALIVAGCAAITPETPQQAREKRAKATRPAYNLTGYPPAVREGYIDGCETAKHSQYARKDAKRMAEDAQYEMGWKDGYGICAKK
jgi:hypothetical protein